MGILKHVAPPEHAWNSGGAGQLGSAARGLGARAMHGFLRGQH